MTSETTDEQFGAALHAFSVSAMNAIILLASRMRGAGALGDVHVRMLHENISLPLSADGVAGNPFIAPMQDYLDQQFANILRVSSGPPLQGQDEHA